MKKTVGKICLFIVCLAVIVFLLLPFLQTPAAKQAEGPAVQTATPQIFTSNPLTELVNRIARFFTKRNTQPAPQQTLTENQVNEQFGTPMDEQALYADARATAQNAISTEATPQAGSARRNSFGDASLQTEEGEWVLIRQTAPEDGLKGMHEINTKDNPYDIYVRQERAARFNPAVQTTAQAAVPDSKWARLFNPIKRFFGFSTPQAVSNAPLSGGNTAAQLASSQSTGSNRGKTGSSFGQADMDMPQLSGSLSGQEATAQSEQPGSLLAYLDPDIVLNEVADSLANAKYPNPQSEKEKREKEAYRQQRMAEAREYFLSRSQERLNRLAAGQEPEDELKNMLEYSCFNEAPRPVRRSSCLTEETEDTRPASKKQLEETKAQNAQLFFQKTNLPMPPAPITLVIGRATGLPQEEIDPEITSEDYIKTMEIYQFMLQNEDCSSKPCYWVANSRQSNTELSDSVEASGAVFKGDPLDKYSQVEQKFTQYKLEQLPENASDQDKQAAQSQAEEFAPAYILYTADNLKDLQAQNREAMKNRDMKAGAALYALTAPIGKQLSQDLDSAVFFYGKDDSFIDADKNASFVERSRVLTNTLADQIQFFQQVAQELRRNTSQEIVRNQTRSEVQEMQKQSQKKRAAFDKSRPGGNR